MSFTRSRGKSSPSITGSRSLSRRCFTSSRLSEHRLLHRSFSLRLPCSICCCRTARTSALVTARYASAIVRASIGLIFSTLRIPVTTTRRCAPSMSRCRRFGFSCVSNMEFCLRYQRPNKSPEPTAVGACSSAIAVHAASRRWLSFFR